MARFYIDTSAYLAVLLGEAGHTAIAAEISRGEWVSSVLLVLEATRNLIRLSREGKLSPAELNQCLERLDQDMQAFQLRDLTLDLCRGRVMPAVSSPRTLDLAHLRTALWFHQEKPLQRFITLDSDQQQSARELGLPV